MIRVRAHICFTVIWLVLVSHAAAQTYDGVKIESVSFSGNEAFSSKILRQIMVNRPSSAFKARFFASGEFDTDREMIVRFYHNEGYLQAEIADYTLTYDDNKDELHIAIVLSEGELTTVTGIDLLGNTAFSDSVLLAHTEIEIGASFRSDDMEKATTSIIRLYADHGYLDALIEPSARIDNESHTALIDMSIQERTQYTVGNIVIEGLEGTKRRVVSRELTFAQGETVNYSELLKSQRNIYLTGIFRSVYIHPAAATGDGSTARDIVIEIRERQNGEFNVSAGYGAIEQYRGRAELYHSNLLGTGNKAGIEGRASMINQIVRLSMTIPRVFGTKWRNDINLLAERSNEPGYDLKRRGGSLSSARSFVFDTQLTVKYRHEDTELQNVSTSELPEDITPRIRSLSLSVIFDNRDNLFNPTKGTYLELSNEWGGFYTGTFDPFIRTTAVAKGFVQTSSRTVLGTSIEGGWLDTAGGLYAIPLQERFYTGGPNSVRGFRYRHAGELDENGKPVGGRVKIVWNVLEVRQHIWNHFDAAVFYDIGGVWSGVKEFTFGSIRQSAGPGVRMNTPIGLARLDAGFKLDRKNGEDRYKLHFSLGQAF